MPHAPARYCAGSPTCPRRAEVHGRCRAHATQHERARGTRHERGYDDAWDKLRAYHIRRHPLCLLCQEQGRVTVAQDVDHIVPFRGKDDPLRLDADNLRSLCRPCHAARHAPRHNQGEAKSLAAPSQRTPPVLRSNEGDFQSSVSDANTGVA